MRVGAVFLSAANVKLLSGLGPAFMDGVRPDAGDHVHGSGPTTATQDAEACDPHAPVGVRARDPRPLSIDTFQSRLPKPSQRTSATPDKPMLTCSSHQEVPMKMLIDFS